MLSVIISAIVSIKLKISNLAENRHKNSAYGYERQQVAKMYKLSLIEAIGISFKLSCIKS